MIFFVKSELASRRRRRVSPGVRSVCSQRRGAGTAGSLGRPRYSRTRLTENDCCRGRLATGRAALAALSLPFPPPRPRALNRRRMHCSHRSGSSSRSASVEPRPSAKHDRQLPDLVCAEDRYRARHVRVAEQATTDLPSGGLAGQTDSWRKIESDIGQPPSHC